MEKLHYLVKKTRVFNFYINLTFFSLMIFFILNFQFFSPFEIIFYTIVGMIISKSITLMMYSLIILLDNDLEEKQNQFDLERSINELNLKMEEDRTKVKKE